MMKHRQRDRLMTIRDWCYVGVALAVLFLIGVATVYLTGSNKKERLHKSHCSGVSTQKINQHYYSRFRGKCKNETAKKVEPYSENVVKSKRIGSRRMAVDT